MTPVLIGNATLYCGDCREILPNLPNVDAVVTDPPYGIADEPITFTDKANGRRGPRGGHSNTWHKPSEWDKELDPSWLPLALASGLVAMFGQWRKRAIFEAQAGMQPRAEITWAKDTHVGAPCPVAPRDERIWVFAKSGIKPRRFETSVWDEPVIPSWKHKHHKNEKPLKLMERLISWLPDGTICDPFMGSGTTGVACIHLGQPFCGVEMDQDHFDIACERIDQAQRQLAAGVSVIGRLFKRPPDFLIGGADRPYIRRWWLIRRNRWFNVYLHQILRDDDDRALHCHPWVNCSVVLSGGYIEVTPDRRQLSTPYLRVADMPTVRRYRGPGSIVWRRATDAHRLELPVREGRVRCCWSLFITGPRIRDWYFHCPRGPVVWWKFVAADDKGAVGRGCEQ